MPLVLDYANLTTERLEGVGIPPDVLHHEIADDFRRALATLRAWREEGRLGFLDLPDTPGLADSVRRTVEPWLDEVDDLLIVGIGGSALGAVVLRDALGGVRWNVSARVRAGRPRLHLLDNPDPDSVAGLLADLDPARTAVNVVSKSGSTAETMALHLCVRGWLEEALDPETVRRRLLFTTDPKGGVLRAMAEREGIATLPIPANLGGRFSVLSAVGLVPAAAIGADLDALLAGAARMRTRALADDLRGNPAGLFATLLHTLHVDHGRPIHVLMPYSDRLRSLALWFQQLWAESLGKEGRGPTPLPALGAVDQHAQVQLFMEGPDDKVILFVAADPDADVEVPVPPGAPAELACFRGVTLGRLLDAERRATTEALRLSGRPSATLEVGRIDAGALGELFMMLEVATVLAGALYDVDPLDQPGVEAGKRFTWGLLGRDSFVPPEIPPADPALRTGEPG
ncbi:MAG: glucose-6-phosphate isomerase [Longimicrobiales bacterium]|nr:glucose-6-phosphate isomerase [Longimicrobiales bacterium]